MTIWTRTESHAEEMRRTRINHKYLPGILIPESIQITSRPEEAVHGAEMLVFAVPSQQYAAVLSDFKEKGLLSKDVPIVNVAKGIDMHTLETPSQMTMRIAPEVPFVVLSGPSHAEEVAVHLPTALVSASKSRKLAEWVQDLFSNDFLRVYTHPDVIGVEISGALKNIIALGAGISDGLGFGDNTKAALITRGIHEISRLGIQMGAQAETFRGLAGVGDLIVTCTSMHSRNRRCGILIGQGKSLDEAIEAVGMVVEGAYTVRSAYLLKERFQLEMPITTELYRVLYEGKDARSAVLHLMTRQKKHEIEELAIAYKDWE
jgi:glycerol-3-phosphate dehydrogenase (NAD(P)+)